MGFYDTYLLPKLVHHVCGQKPAMKQREKIVPLAEARVLEWAAGAPAAVDIDALSAAAAAAFGLPGTLAGAVRQMARAVLDSPQCAHFFSAPALR